MSLAQVVFLVAFVYIHTEDKHPDPSLKLGNRHISYYHLVPYFDCGPHIHIHLMYVHVLGHLIIHSTL